MKKFTKKIYVIILKKFEIGSAIAVRLTKYLGKSEEFIHPKHFITSKPWFVKFLKSNDYLLDLGSGNGQNSLKSAKIVKKVIGLEMDPALIKIAQKTSSRNRIKNVIFSQANLENGLKYSKSSFDKILFLDVLEHLRKRNSILNDIHRILKPHGYLILAVPNKSTSWKKLQKSVGITSFSDPDHKIEYSENDIKRLLAKSKFKIDHFGYAPYDTPLRGLFDIVGAISITVYKKIHKWRQEKVKKNSKESSGFEIVAQKL